MTAYFLSGRLIQDIKVTTRRVADQANFTICNMCFWCATVLYRNKEIRRCPMCHTEAMKIIPITDEESFTIKYNPTFDMTLEFTIDVQWENAHEY